MSRPAHLAAVLAALAGLSWGTPAAAFPDDVRVDRLGELDVSRRQARFEFVVRELALVASGSPDYAVEALGLYEFEVTLENRLGFLHTEPVRDEDVSAWDSMVDGGEAAAIAYLPALRVRKGLPWSFEVGGDLAWHGGTEALVVGGYGRWAFLGGWSKVPDMAVQLGYRGYVGNPQLELGVFSLDLSLGYSFQVGRDPRRPASWFAPFAGYSFLMSHAAPGVPQVEGVQAVSAWVPEEGPRAGLDPARFRFHRAFLGLQIHGGGVVFRLSGDFAFGEDLPVVPGVNLGVGFRI